ncbi:hypothetical protein CYMTET_56248 [Cymbomonas tetramitiformis]|uniref:RNase NYN domain-containing protein n=1 Tax=Cymbomonas tetramitiformis TaxID=36881 RepID=A0AAE0BBB6_9CHLO|nr:hypothetical protein CYMTET_56248 [Cymbomonas tetramitiformis]
MSRDCGGGLVISGRIFYHPGGRPLTPQTVASSAANHSLREVTGLGPGGGRPGGTASQEEAEEEEEEEELKAARADVAGGRRQRTSHPAEGPKPHVPGDPLEDGKIRGLLVGVDLGGASSESAATARRHRAGAGGSGGGARGKKIPPALPAAPGSFVPPSRPDFAPLGWAEHPGGAQLIIVDAPNVAMRHGGRRKCFSCKGIQIVLEYWLQRGHKVKGFLPEYYTNHEYVGGMRAATKLGLADNPARIPDNIALIQDLVERGLLVLTPPQDYDDSYCIAYARNHGGYIVTNDRYWDYIEKAGQARGEALQWIRSHCISFAFAGDEFMPNPDFHFLSS